MISVDNRLDQGQLIMSGRRERNWELHDGAEIGYVMHASSDSEADLPLAKISSGNRTTPIPIAKRRRSPHMKLITAGNFLIKYQSEKWRPVF